MPLTQEGLNATSNQGSSTNGTNNSSNLEVISYGMPLTQAGSNATSNQGSATNGTNNSSNLEVISYGIPLTQAGSNTTSASFLSLSHKKVSHSKKNKKNTRILSTKKTKSSHYQSTTNKHKLSEVNIATTLLLGNINYTINREINAFWINNFTVSLDGYPCINSDSNPTLSLKYPLLNLNDIGCGEYGNTKEYMTLLDSESQIYLYEANNVYDSIISKLPYSSKYFTNSDVFDLYYENRVNTGKDDTCWSLTYDVLYYSPDDLNDTVSDINDLSIVILVLSIIALIIIILQIISNYIQFLEKYFYGRSLWTFLVLLLCLIVVILIIILAIIVFDQNSEFTKLSNIQSIYDAVLNSNCIKVSGFSSALSYKSDYFYESFYLVYVFVILLFVLALIFLFFTLLCLIIRLVKYNDGIARAFLREY